MLFVDPALFHRHLGLPRGTEPDPATASLADAARDWYREHGDPWAHVSIREIRSIEGDRVLLEGDILTSAVLADGFRAADARQLAMGGVSAGAAVDREIDARFQSDRPDEAMILNAFAVAVAEHLRARQGRRLRRQFTKSNRTVLPHYSPGYDGWELDDQATLFAALEEQGPLRLLPSGGLRPARSALAVFGITAEAVAPSLLDAFWHHCRGNATAGDLGGPAGHHYAFPEKTLAKWSRERLTIEERPDSGIAARFRFDGITCSSLGLPLAFDYSIELSAGSAERRQIVNSGCRPAECNVGYRSMCGYLADPDRMVAAFGEQSLVGRSLDEAIGLPGEISPSGCLCLRSNRNHKWSIVLQTLHYRLQTEPRE